MASRLPLLKLEVVRGLQKASVEVVDAVEEEVVVVVGRWVVREVMLGTRRAARWWTRRSWRGGWTTSADGRVPGMRELHLEAGCQGGLLGGCVGFPNFCQKANCITKSAFSAFFCLSAFFTELDFKTFQL